MRRCKQCGKRIKIPHIRVWEENVVVSHMITFCSIDCMVKFYSVKRMYNYRTQEVVEQ